MYRLTDDEQTTADLYNRPEMIATGPWFRHDNATIRVVLFETIGREETLYTVQAQRITSTGCLFGDCKRPVPWFAMAWTIFENATRTYMAEHFND